MLRIRSTPSDIICVVVVGLLVCVDTRVLVFVSARCCVLQLTRISVDDLQTCGEAWAVRASSVTFSNALYLMMH